MTRIPITDEDAEQQPVQEASDAEGAQAESEPEPAEAEVIDPEAPEQGGTAEDDPKAAASPKEGDSSRAAGPAPSRDEELVQARREAAESKDRLIRLQAEWDNYRKRTAAERIAERARATEHLVSNLLPVVDDLDRALEHVADDASEELKGFAEGITGVQKKLTEVLGHESVEPIGKVGEAFDPSKHQAVGKAEDASVPDETVTQVYQKGYSMAGKVLRPAVVIISTGGPARTSDDDAPSGADADK